jgi:hypothetical protein
MDLSKVENNVRNMIQQIVAPIIELSKRNLEHN